MAEARTRTQPAGEGTAVSEAKQSGSEPRDADQPVRQGGATDLQKQAHHHARTIKGLKFGVRAALIVVVLVIGFAVMGLLIATKPKSKTRSEAPPSVLVRAIEATPRSIERVWEGYGTVVSMRRATVAAEVGGRVIDRPAAVEAGRAIDAGSLLVAIDPVDYEAAEARAAQAAVALRAQLDGLAVESERLSVQMELIGDEIAAAERDLERTRQAIEQGAGSPGELDSKISLLRRSQREQEAVRQQLDLIPTRRSALEGELGAREADLRQARSNLARARVVSPIQGVIDSVSPRVGDFVAPGTPVATVVDLSRLEIPLKVPASAASWVRVGDEVRVWQGEPVGEPTHTGRVTRLAPTTDPATRTITVFAEVEQDPDRADRLLPGGFVHGRVLTPDPSPRVAVPRRAIRSGRVMTLSRGEGGLFVVRPVPVEQAYPLDGLLPEIDPTETEWAVLSSPSGLDAGVLIATTSLEAICPGGSVRVEVAGESETPDGNGEG